MLKKVKKIAALMMATMALSTLFVTTAFAQENDVEVIEEAKILEEIVSHLEDGVTIDVAPNESKPVSYTHLQVDVNARNRKRDAAHRVEAQGADQNDRGNDQVAGVGEVDLVLDNVAHADGGDHAVQHKADAADDEMCIRDRC